MELYQIRYFLAVVDAMNFTRAAERCFVSQPALTKAIQRLEETLGGRLFDRSKNSLLLTELGRAMLPNFRQLYEGAKQAREQARSITAERKHRVRVGVMCTIDFHQVLPGFLESQDAHDIVELTFMEGNFEALSNALDQGDVDLSIMCSPHDIARRFNVTTLFREHYVVAIGSDHRYNGRTQIEIAELHRERYCERVQCEYSDHIERLLDARSVAVEVVQESSTEDWIQALVRANFGVAFMPISLAKAANLAFVYTSDCPIVREVSVLSRSDRPLTPAEQLVIDSLIRYQWMGARPAVG